MHWVWIWTMSLSDPLHSNFLAQRGVIQPKIFNACNCLRSVFILFTEIMSFCTQINFLWLLCAFKTFFIWFFFLFVLVSLLFGKKICDKRHTQNNSHIYAYALKVFPFQFYDNRRDDVTLVKKILYNILEQYSSHCNDAIFDKHSFA